MNLLYPPIRDLMDCCLAQVVLNDIANLDSAVSKHQSDLVVVEWFAAAY